MFPLISATCGRCGLLRETLSSCGVCGSVWLMVRTDGKLRLRSLLLSYLANLVLRAVVTLVVILVSLFGLRLLVGAPMRLCVKVTVLVLVSSALLLMLLGSISCVGLCPVVWQCLKWQLLSMKLSVVRLGVRFEGVRLSVQVLIGRVFGRRVSD